MSGVEEDEPSCNRASFSYYPLSLFETLHHHVYKNDEFMQYLRVTFGDRRQQQEANKLTWRHSNNHLVSTRSENALVQGERQRWRAMSWAVTLIEWHRSSAWKNKYKAN